MCLKMSNHQSTSFDNKMILRVAISISNYKLGRGYTQ